MEQPTKKCPRCEEEYTGASALSRTDNQTPICEDCGQAEAMEAFMAWRADGTILFPCPKDWPRQRLHLTMDGTAGDLVVGDPQLLEGADGKAHWMREVRELSEGRWEPHMTFTDAPGETNSSADHEVE